MPELTLKQIYKKAKERPGRCFNCRAELGDGRGRAPIMCSRKACRRIYEKAYREAKKGPSALRSVVHVSTPGDQPRRRLVKLDCGHTLDLPASIGAINRKRRHCPTCKEKEAA